MTGEYVPPLWDGMAANTWTYDDDTVYQLALEAIDRVVAACSVLIADEVARPDPNDTLIVTWNLARIGALTTRRNLRVGDTATLTAVQSRYADLAREIATAERHLAGSVT